MIKELHRMMDMKRSAVDDIRSELILARRIIADFSGALNKDWSTIIELQIQLAKSTTAAKYTKATIRLLED